MKLGWRIDGKTIDIDLVVKEAEYRQLSPEEASIKMGMGKMYLRNRRNENKNNIYRVAYSGVVDKVSKFLGVSKEEILIDIPTIMEE